VTLVVILTIREGALEELRAFETSAARVMAKHGGSIERSVVISSPHPGADAREVHVVTFPDAAAYAAYRADEALVALAPLRARAIVSTEVLVGEDGPDYDALARA
jgi:uncharacterized protein (DUF1330 family)